MTDKDERAAFEREAALLGYDLTTGRTQTYMSEITNDALKLWQARSRQVQSPAASDDVVALLQRIHDEIISDDYDGGICLQTQFDLEAVLRQQSPAPASCKTCDKLGNLPGETCGMCGATTPPSSMRELPPLPRPDFYLMEDGTLGQHPRANDPEPTPLFMTESLQQYALLSIAGMRDAVLEEAAKEILRLYPNDAFGKIMAEAIRALKEKK